MPISMDSPFVAPPNKFLHCPHFKMSLEASIGLIDNSLLALESFVDNTKASLDITMCAHYEFAPYAEWTKDYLVTTIFCPPDQIHHPRYQAMCVNYNAYGRVLHQFLQTDADIAKDRSPNASHELTALDNIRCG
jgi:hypothetical protein